MMVMLLVRSDVAGAAPVHAVAVQVAGALVTDACSFVLVFLIRQHSRTLSLAASYHGFLFQLVLTFDFDSSVQVTAS